MDHERLHHQVPALCEHCYNPIDIGGGDDEVTSTCSWPGTEGRVFFHTPCVLPATANLAKPRRLRRLDGS